MEAPSISVRHLRELKDKFPYVSYVWNRETHLFEVWCEETKGLPYKFIDVAGPNGEYRDPGAWVIRELQFSDAETGEWQTGTVAGRKNFIDTLYDPRVFAKHAADHKAIELEQMRNSARYVNHHGRVFGSQERTSKQYRMDRKLGG